MYFRMKLPQKRIPRKKLEVNYFHFDENRYTGNFEPTPPPKILPKVYFCKLCPKRCSTWADVRKHTDNVHKRPCPIAGCKKRFWRRNGQRNSLQSDMSKHFAQVHPNEPVPTL